MVSAPTPLTLALCRSGFRSLLALFITRRAISVHGGTTEAPMPHDYETALTQAADEVADREPTATHVKDAGRAAAKDEIRVAMASDLLCMLVEPDDPHMPPSLDGVEHDLRCALRQRGALDGGA